MGAIPQKTMELIRMEKKSKIGVLRYVAGTGAKGIKFEDEPETWYNPATDEAKEQVKQDYKGKQVEIMLVDGKKTEFSSMVLLEKQDQEAEEKEEVIVETEQVEETQEQPKEEKAPEKPAETKKETISKKTSKDQEEEENPLKELFQAMKGLEYTQAVYKEMESTKLETAQKGPHKLTYASWAEAWGSLKRIHPTATFKVYENEDGVPAFFNKELPSMGAFVKVSVSVLGLAHTVHLPVMDHSNKSIPLERMTTFDINKNIQRALAKAIALHGMGLYVFKGEDFPEDK